MILWLTCTHGRYKCLQRNLRCYLDQDHTSPSVMFICNSGSPLKLPDAFIIPANKSVYIDNCSLMNFQSVGEKYNHAIKLAKQLYPDTQIVTSADDDDIFLPNHLSEGWKGIYKGLDVYGYKPQKSYYRYRDLQGNLKIDLQENTLEPSIFVYCDWLLDKGYANVSVKYHQQWLDPLIYEGKLKVDIHGTPTLVYNWGDNGDTDGDYSIYKMSGSGNDNRQNFVAHQRSSKDMGNGILYPLQSNDKFYNEIKVLNL